MRVVQCFDRPLKVFEWFWQVEQHINADFHPHGDKTTQALTGLVVVCGPKRATRGGTVVSMPRKVRENKTSPE